MGTYSNFNLLRSGIENIRTRLAHTRQRRMLVLSGDLDWAKCCLQDFLSAVSSNELLVVSSSPFDSAHPTHPAEKVLKQLGTEVAHVVWNGHDGVHPDAFGAAGGLVKGGGLMVLLIPDMTRFVERPDPDYVRMCSVDAELEACGTRFLKRFAEILVAAPGCILLEQHMPTEALTKRIEAGMTTVRPEVAQTQSDHALIGDQSQALEAIMRLAKGHRNRPLVLTADRGRGKTSLLGIAAARSGRKVIITAPQKRSVEQAFKHFDRWVSRSTPELKEACSQLTFLTPEDTARGHADADLVFVDEAAALPVEVLTRILSRYSRIVFSSTIHGYEGSGQGFSLRFSRVLDQRCPGWKQLSMKAPIRYSHPDMLEQLLFELLALNAEAGTCPATWLEATHILPTLDFHFVSQASLASDHNLLNQVMGLLVLAHYQTSPSDLRMLLDQPRLQLLVCQREQQVVAAALCVEESAIDCPDLHIDIIAGKRRLKGRIVPQALASFSMDPVYLHKTFFRVVRITVHPDLFGRGIGTHMLGLLEEFAGRQGYDFISASYAFSVPVHAFWRSAGFRTVRLGYSKDTASGSPSLITLKALHDNSKHLLNLKGQFEKHFCYGLARFYRYSDWRLIAALCSEMGSGGFTLNAQDRQNIDLFGGGFRSEFDALASLEKLVLESTGGQELKQLKESFRQLLILRILQQRDWKECVEACELTGKKEGMSTLRVAIRHLAELHFTRSGSTETGAAQQP